MPSLNFLFQFHLKVKQNFEVPPNLWRHKTKWMFLLKQSKLKWYEQYSFFISYPSDWKKTFIDGWCNSKSEPIWVTIFNGHLTVHLSVWWDLRTCLGENHVIIEPELVQLLWLALKLLESKLRHTILLPICLTLNNCKIQHSHRFCGRRVTMTEKFRDQILCYRFATKNWCNGQY